MNEPFGSLLFSSDLPQTVIATLSDFLQGILVALPAHLAILDENGRIIALNRSRRELADGNNQNDPAYGIGQDFFTAFERVLGLNSAFAHATREGLRQILAEERSTFTLEFPSPSPTQRRWVLMRAYGFRANERRFGVVLQEDITQRVLAEEQARSLAQLSAENPNPVMRIATDGQILYVNGASTPILSAWGCDADGSLSATWRVQFATIFKLDQSTLLDIPCGEHLYRLEIIPVSASNCLNVYGYDLTEHKEAALLLQAKTQEERTFQTYLKELHAISLELTQIDSLDDFYKRVVELGRSRLGLDRLALFLYEEKTGMAQGTYGTDPRGQIRDERAIQFAPDPEDILMRALGRTERFCVVESAPLRDNEQPIGVGWNAAAALWSGTKMVGWLVADNLIEQEPASKALLEIFALYALTVGTLLGQKQASSALQDSEEKFRLLVEAAPEAIVISNCQGTIALVNAEAEQVFGYPRAELLGQSIELLVPEPQREVHRRHHDCYITAPSRRPMSALPELSARRKDGSQFPAEIQLSAVQTPDDWLVISFIADISERKQAEEALQRALEQQKELVDLKSRFIAMASHDFRTPMSVILSSSNLLEMQISRQFGAEQVEPFQKRLKRIDESVHQMTSLLDDVLTVNRNDTGRVELHPERLDIEGLCQACLQEIQMTASDQHHLTFVCRGEATGIVSDPQLLRQILINLLSNGVKYSPEGGTVGLEVRYEPKAVEIRVQDEGIGIPEADQARLFEVFHRAHNVGEIKGTGLGMAIVKRAVDALGGTISFESQVGVGTTFTVQLPTVFRTD